MSQVIKTNFGLVQDLLGVYEHKVKGFVLNEEEEIDIIKQTLSLENMDCIELQNIRDFVVIFLQRKGDQALFASQSENISEASRYESYAEYDKIFDKMSAITYVIDLVKVQKGYEV